MTLIHKINKVITIIKLFLLLLNTETGETDFGSSYGRRNQHNPDLGLKKALESVDKILNCDHSNESY